MYYRVFICYGEFISNKVHYIKNNNLFILLIYNEWYLICGSFLISLFHLYKFQQKKKILLFNDKDVICIIDQILLCHITFNLYIIITWIMGKDKSIIHQNPKSQMDPLLCFYLWRVCSLTAWMNQELTTHTFERGL